MKKALVVITGILAFGMLMGCSYGAGPQFGTMGWIYTDYNGPVTATDSNAGYSKMGVSTYNNVLGIVATGDGSIQAAMANGGISRIHHIDYKNFSVLGVYHKMTVMVYGD